MVGERSRRSALSKRTANRAGRPCQCHLCQWGAGTKAREARRSYYGMKWPWRISTKVRQTRHDFRRTPFFPGLFPG